MHGDPYAALVLYAERERVLVDEGRVEELEALAAERSALIAGLPRQAPPSARPYLERAHSLQLATAAVLKASLAELRHSMVSLDRSSSAARAYAVGPAPASASSISAAA
jgi:hypothetical protein